MTGAIEGTVVQTSNGKNVAGLTPGNPALSALQKRVWRMYAIDGMTQSEIGEAVGKSQRYISDIISAVRKLLPQETREKIIQEHIDDLRSMRNALWPAASRGAANAIKAYVKVLEREARMLGLDAPTALAVQSDGRQVVYTILDPDLEAMQ